MYPEEATVSKYVGVFKAHRCEEGMEERTAKGSALKGWEPAQSAEVRAEKMSFRVRVGALAC